LARQFKELPEKELRKWEKKAEQDKIRYSEEMKHYVPMDDPDGGGRKKKAKKVRYRAARSIEYFLLEFHFI
jgi:high mobility group protein B2